MSTQVTQELGFSTYVFVERLGKNAAILHPFPEFNISLVARALEEAGLPISIMGEHAPERGEGIYFQEDPFPDEFLGILADALSVRGIGAYAYCLVDGSLGDLEMHLFTRVGGSFPRAGKKVVLMRLYLGRNAEGPAATTWIFGAPADLEEVNGLLGEKYDTQPVSDPAGFVAIEIQHPEFSAGLQEPSQIMDDIFQTLGRHGFEGPAFVEDHFSQSNDANL